MLLLFIYTILVNELKHYKMSLTGTCYTAYIISVLLKLYLLKCFINLGFTVLSILNISSFPPIKTSNFCVVSDNSLTKRHKSPNQSYSTLQNKNRNRCCTLNCSVENTGKCNLEISNQFGFTPCQWILLYLIPCSLPKHRVSFAVLSMWK